MARPNLSPADFVDGPSFGIDWKDKYVLLMRPMSPRQDNKGNRVTLPAGAIGHVASASPGSILVAFDRDPKRVPEPVSAFHPVNSADYGVVIGFVFNDWRSLDLRRTR